LFIYGWNQYLWPSLITTDGKTHRHGHQTDVPSGDDVANWPVIMATSILAMIPPVIVVISMQNSSAVVDGENRRTMAAVELTPSRNALANRVIHGVTTAIADGVHCDCQAVRL
jgi:hypothetical protein